MLNPGILIPFFKLLSIRREINFCLDVLLPSSLRVDAAGTPFLLPSRGAHEAGTGGRKRVAPSVHDGSLDRPLTEEEKSGFC